MTASRARFTPVISPWLLRHKRVALAALAAGTVLIGAALWTVTRPGMRFGPQDGTWRRIQINRDLYVGLDPSYPPLAEWTPDGITGMEADIAREIGRRIGAETSILIMGYDSLYDSLYTGQVDLIIAGLRRDEALTHWVYYTRPYFDGGQYLVSRDGEPFTSIRALDGSSIAVELASAADLEARRWQRRLHTLSIETFILPEDAMDAVRSGQANAALVDAISARLYLAQQPGLSLAPTPTASDPFVVAMRKENFRLNEEVDSALAAMAADGTLDAIIDRWL